MLQSSLPCHQESATAMSQYSNNVLSTQWMSTEMVLPSDITSLCHVSCTQWISTEMVSWGTISHCCASPVWRTQWTSSETVLTQRSPATMSHSHYDLSTQWISSKTVLPSEITKHCLTVTMTEAHGEYPAKWCHHQKSFRNHLYMSCKLHVHHECFCLVHTVLHTQWVSTEMVLPWGITIHHQSGPHCFTHTHTHRVSTEMVLPSTVTDHSPSLSSPFSYTVNGFKNGMALPVTLITPPTIHP